MWWRSHRRPGRIPGARNAPWSLAVNADGTFKSREALEELYLNQLGLSPDQETVTYCRIGERSSHTWFILQFLLGFKKVKNYDGSWTEYGNLIGVPIERDALPAPAGTQIPASATPPRLAANA